MKRFSLALCTAAALLASACGDSTGPDSDLQSARARWDQKKPAAYSYTVHRGCFCPPEARGPVTVVIRNGAVESRRYIDTGALVPDTYAQSFPTVEELFAQIDTLKAQRPVKLEITYDPVYGFPTLIDVDISFRLADEEFTLVMSAFTVR